MPSTNQTKRRKTDDGWMFDANPKLILQMGDKESYCLTQLRRHLDAQTNGIGRSLF